jgi:hypothetical protein
MIVVFDASGNLLTSFNDPDLCEAWVADHQEADYLSYIGEEGGPILGHAFIARSVQTSAEPRLDVLEGDVENYSGTGV